MHGLELAGHVTVRSGTPAPFAADAAAAVVSAPSFLPPPSAHGSPSTRPRVQVVAAATALFVWRGCVFSQQFEQGQRWDGYAPGLQPSALLGGKRVVSCELCYHAWLAMLLGQPVRAAVPSLVRASSSHPTTSCCWAHPELPLTGSLLPHSLCCLPRTCPTSSGASSEPGCPHWPRRS